MPKSTFFFRLVHSKMNTSNRNSLSLSSIHYDAHTIEVKCTKSITTPLDIEKNEGLAEIEKDSKMNSIL